MREAGCKGSMGYARSLYGETKPCDLYGPFNYAEDGYPEVRAGACDLS